jgi:hypothetical protein
MNIEHIHQLRSILTAFPELRGMQHVDVAVACSPAREEINIRVRWWQCGEWQDVSVLYPESDWKNGLSDLAADAVARAVALRHLFRRNTGES